MHTHIKTQTPDIDSYIHTCTSWMAYTNTHRCMHTYSNLSRLMWSWCLGLLLKLHYCHGAIVSFWSSWTRRFSTRGSIEDSGGSVKLTKNGFPNFLTKRPANARLESSVLLPKRVVVVGKGSNFAGNAASMRASLGGDTPTHMKKLSTRHKMWKCTGMSDNKLEKDIVFMRGVAGCAVPGGIGCSGV